MKQKAFKELVASLDQANDNSDMICHDSEGKLVDIGDILQDVPMIQQADETYCEPQEGDMTIRSSTTIIQAVTDDE